MTQPAEASGQFNAVMAPAQGPPPPVIYADGSVWWKILAVAMPAIFAAGGAWVQLARLSSDLDQLRQSQEAHAAQAGHREGVARLGTVERDVAELRADRDRSTRRVDEKLDQIRDTLARLCASQPRNPCGAP